MPGRVRGVAVSVTSSVTISFVVSATISPRGIPQSKKRYVTSSRLLDKAMAGRCKSQMQLTKNCALQISSSTPFRTVHLLLWTSPLPTGGRWLSRGPSREKGGGNSCGGRRPRSMVSTMYRACQAAGWGFATMAIGTWGVWPRRRQNPTSPGEECSHLAGGRTPRLPSAGAA